MGSIGRNVRCPCGSGRKFKKCCLPSASPDDLARLISLENLKRRVQNSDVFLGDKRPIVLQDPRDVRKMSEIILEFARPILGEVALYDDYEKAILMAITAWNLAFDDQSEADAKLEELCNEIFRPSNADLEIEFRQHMSNLIQRKQNHYSDVLRYVEDWDLVKTGHGFHLNVVSTLSPDYVVTKELGAESKKQLESEHL